MQKIIVIDNITKQYAAGSILTWVDGWVGCQIWSAPNTDSIFMDLACANFMREVNAPQHVTQQLISP